jgi:hypothetical protein
MGSGLMLLLFQLVWFVESFKFAAECCFYVTMNIKDMKVGVVKRITPESANVVM